MSRGAGLGQTGPRAGVPVEDDFPSAGTGAAAPGVLTERPWHTASAKEEVSGSGHCWGGMLPKRDSKCSPLPTSHSLYLACGWDGLETTESSSGLATKHWCPGQILTHFSTPSSAE